MSGLQVPLAANSVIVQIIGMSFMVPLGVGIACSTHIGASRAGEVASPRERLVAQETRSEPATPLWRDVPRASRSA